MALTKITTGGISDDAVTDAKLPANSVGNSEMKDDAVGGAELSATGTAGNTTYLRGDNTWTVPPDTNTTVGDATGVDFDDNVKVRFGTDNDAYMYYAGASGGEVSDQGDTLHIRNTDGKVHIRADEFILISDDSGGRAIYTDESNSRLELGFDGNHDAHFKGDGVEFLHDVQINAQKDLRFADADSSNYVAVQSPATVASNYTVTLPAAAPTENGQALTATTGGVASWTTVTSKLDTPVITGDLEVADAGTVTHTITNYDPELTYTFSSLSNCTIGTINTSGQFVVTETGDHPAYTVKAETDALGLADSNTLTKQLKTKLSAPTLSSPADDGTATNIVYTITSTHANDNKLILDIGSSNFTYQSVSHGSGSKVGNTVEVTGFTTNNPAVTIQFTAEATYSVTAKAQDTTGTWGDSVASSADSITIQNSYTVDYLVVAGGGGSGRSHGGGGGGGGFRASYNNETSGGGGSSETALQLVPGTVYTIDVGAAGTGGDFSATNGAASSISGSDITDVTTVGGGRGASRSPNHGGSSGGSGGGGTDGHPGGPSGSGLAGTTNEGYAGGNGVYGSNHYNGGGGGGAGQVGGNAQIGSPGGGPGGNGQSSTITGSSTTYAGGGGGGMGSGQGANTPGGPGGSGGGGSGGSDGGGNPGTANTGGGGGGAGGSGYWGSTGGGRPGGTGVVILRMATANYNSSGLDGSPTVTTSGSDTILTYTADGEYTG